ncbi:MULTISPECIES: hypothetical protein [unclassified Halomonas]|uniref:hypothetical protein n=1 Tax=unclassified Halomonas TaxID=2609666 RepID=UPI000ACEFCBB|nr:MULTISPECIES: hypothetical protein [unclassified Halomonas]MBT2788399.1 hypothetical protein [Halomonas sp. ISL-106]MBT2797990.1 hypothetical protein [Halomonas sp. ISL-104]
MFEFALVSVSIFGFGDWYCSPEPSYEGGIRESIHTHVVTHEDLSYDESIILQYQMEDADRTQSQLRVFVSGEKNVIGNDFTVHPQEIKISVDFDKIEMFTPEFLQVAQDFYLEDSGVIEVVDVNEQEMKLRSKEAGNEIVCQSSPGFNQ